MTRNRVLFFSNNATPVFNRMMQREWFHLVRGLEAGVTISEQGVDHLGLDSVGAERKGHTKSATGMRTNFKGGEPLEFAIQGNNRFIEGSQNRSDFS